MNHIESYNASYPLSYYKIGTVYSFYGTSNMQNTAPASAEQISRYSGTLIALEQEDARNAIKPMTGSSTTTARRGGMSRYYAVVVDKVSAQKSSGITVMFINRDAGETEYLLKKYAVSHPVHLDGKDLMPVSTHTSYGIDNRTTNSPTKPGQLTKATKDEKVGQLTRSGGKENPSTGSSAVGQLTHAKGTEASPKAEPKVGQLTWSNRRR